MSNSLSLTNRRSLRHTFGELSDTVNMPNLIAIQRSSYQQFLDSKIDTNKKNDFGIDEKKLKSIIVDAGYTIQNIENFNGTIKSVRNKYEK